MNFSYRLREERERLGLNQVEFGAIGGVKKLAQINYEKGEREPDASYMAAIAMAGANVLYILTGQREGPAPEALSAEERVMLGYFRQASPAVRKAALGALLSTSMQSAKPTTQTASSGGVNVGGSNSGVIQSNTQPGAVQIVGKNNVVVRRK